jgi:ADP-dependent NAD(P)H-hydrate dehydratase / NAD(P)H-hydrate epimerase
MDPKDMMVVDANAEALGIPKSSLMENAGRSVAESIVKKFEPCKVVIYAGNGGNGGDGFVAARYLLEKGYEVEINLLGSETDIRTFETKLNWDCINNISNYNSSINIYEIKDSSQLKTTYADVVVDSILGTGIRGSLREPVASAVDIINTSVAKVFAVDIPTGLDPVNGNVNNAAVKADFTVTFHKPKTGLLKADPKYIGSLEVYDIGIPNEAEMFTGPGDLLRLINRSEKSHKGQNGRVLIVGGSKNYSGAPAFAGLSALRSGVDLSVIACPKSVSSSIRAYSPDLIVKSLSNSYIQFEDSSDILQMSESADSIVIGCGIGTKEETGLVLNEIIEKIKLPMVLDADALKVVDNKIISQSNNNIVLTPHKAEFRAFFDIDLPSEFLKKIEIVKQTAKDFGCTILLKGSVDIISNGQIVKLNSTGNPGMTVGGTGDILAGLVGGLLAGGHTVIEAAYMGAYINGAAGNLAESDYGYNFIASDMLKYIPLIFMDK